MASNEDGDRSPSPVSRPLIARDMLNRNYLSWDLFKHQAEEGVFFVPVYFIGPGNATIRYGLDLATRNDKMIKELHIEEKRLPIALWQCLKELKDSVAALKPRTLFVDDLQSFQQRDNYPEKSVLVLKDLYYHIGRRIGDKDEALSADYFEFFLAKHPNLSSVPRPSPLNSIWNRVRFKDNHRVHMTDEGNFESFMSYLLYADPTNPMRFTELRRRNQRGTVDPDFRTGRVTEDSHDWTQYELELRVTCQMYFNLNDALEATRNRPRSTAQLLEELRRANVEDEDDEETDEMGETASDSRSSTVMEICDDNE